MRVARRSRHCNFWSGVFPLLQFSLGIVSLSLVSGLVPVQASHATEGTPCALVDDAMRVASRIRGLKELRTVPCRIQERAQVEKYLLDTIKEKVPQARLKYEGEAYRLLGIIPKDFDYLKGIVDLYTSQLGGYYDPEKEYYAMASWMPAQLQFSIAVHELVHALQDQHYELDAMMDHHQLDGDLLMARSALVEGDATAVMIDFTRELAGQGPIMQQESVASMMMQNIAGAMFSSSMQETPSALQTMLIFPYVSGLRFAHAILQSGGYGAIDKAFKKLPESTEHILHPEIYLRGERSFVDVPVPGVPSGIRVVSTKPLYQDRMGEFFISTFLGGHLAAQSASAAAAGWGGDRLALYELSGSSRYLLVWALHWDTQKDADEFFEALSEYYAKRLGSASAGNGEERRFLDPDFGPVELKKKEKNVRLTIGR